jgi:tetratricopeptide (TPR) repeat protein
MAILMLLAGAASGLTLSDKMHGRISKGNKDYEEENHEEALDNYMKAQGLDSTHAVPHFNAGDAFYRMGKFPEGAEEFLRSAASPTDSIAAMSYYNLGNSMFKANDYQSAIEAYKRSLLMDPDDEDAKFNLELAMRMMQQQEQEQDQKQDEDEAKKKERDQEQQGKDQQEEDQQQQEQDMQDEQQQQQDQQQQQPRQQPQEITPEELERILAAIEASDKNTQEEMLKKTSRRKTISGKDW